MQRPRQANTVSKRFTLSAAGVLLAAQAAQLPAQDTADADKSPRQEPVPQQQSATQNGSTSRGSEWRRDFTQVDADGNGTVEWAEVENVYRDQLNAVGWEKQDVMSRYDPDDDQSLNRNEYNFFVTGLEYNHGQRSSSTSSENSQAEVASSEHHKGPQNISDRRTAGAPSIERPDSTAELVDGHGNTGSEHDESEGVSTPRSTADASGSEASELQSGSSGERQTQSLASTSESHEQISPKVPTQSEQEASAGSDAGAAVTLITVTAVEPVPISEIEGRAVVNLEGRQVGTVADVVTNPQANKTGLVVSVGGFWGIGEKHVLVQTDEIQLSDDQVVWQTRNDEKELEGHPEYNSQDYVSIR